MRLIQEKDRYVNEWCWLGSTLNIKRGIRKWSTMSTIARKSRCMRTEKRVKNVTTKKLLVNLESNSFSWMVGLEAEGQGTVEQANDMEIQVEHVS